MPGSKPLQVYIVWIPFTEVLGATTHVSVWQVRKTAERIAKKHGGLVIPRRVHLPYENDDEDAGPPLFDPE